jgi:hypothetical protein
MALFYIEELTNLQEHKAMWYGQNESWISSYNTNLLAYWSRVQSTSMNRNKKKKYTSTWRPLPFVTALLMATRKHSEYIYNQMVMRSYPSTTSGTRGSCHTWIFSSRWETAQRPEWRTRSSTSASNKRRWTWTDEEEKAWKSVNPRLEKSQKEALK